MRAKRETSLREKKRKKLVSLRYSQTLNTFFKRKVELTPVLEKTKACERMKGKNPHSYSRA